MSESNKYSNSWNFGPTNHKNMKVIEVARFAKKFLMSRSKIAIKSHHFHESKYLALDSKKSKKRLNWQTHLTNQNAIRMTLEWFQNYYDQKERKNLLNFSFRQIKEITKLHNF